MLHPCVFVIFGASIAVFVGGTVNPGPSYPATKGEAWPKPQLEEKEDLYFTIDPSNFHVKITNKNCPILSRAVHRYSYVVENLNKLVVKSDPVLDPTVILVRSQPYNNTTESNNHQGLMKDLEVELSASCEEYPHLEMDESYSITVARKSKIQSSSVWGILRGLETFAQLLYLSDDFQEMRLNKTQIRDFPRYAHRGLLLDTARHYISMDVIIKMLDAMAINKLNVFHWHIVDDQSFPYQSEKFPELSARGAYHPSMIYTKYDVQNVIEYARDRGIRVIPEFDVPGHTRSWGEAFPNVLTECNPGYYGDNVQLGPMNPVNNSTYKLIKQLFEEVQDLFKDKFLHVGGDEVELSCWRSNPDLRKYMTEKNITAEGLHALFMRNVIPMLENRSTPIVWEEVFDEGVPLTKETLVQMWKNEASYPIIKALLAGYRVLYSSSWYLDHLSKDFWYYYRVDPRQMVISATNNVTLANGIVGGEACMWGEMIDDRNVLSRVWPRASAVAERLWSAYQYIPYYSSYAIPEATRRRAEEHTCRMIRRGIPAQPVNGPGYCIA